MKMKWAIALFVLIGLSGIRAWADGFGFTIANAAVANVKAAGNTNVLVAEVGDTFSVTGAPFTSFRSYGDTSPAITDNDLNLYTADFNGIVVEVKGNEVRYTGTFALKYNGAPAVTVVTGKLDIRAAYDAQGAAVLAGFLVADPKIPGLPPKFDKDFSLFNPARFFGTYAPKPGDHTQGTMSANANAGAIGFATSVDYGPINNIKATGNTDLTHAQVGDTFTMTAPLSTYFTLGGPPLNNNDLDRYTLEFAGIVTDVTGTLVTYKGTFTLKYTAPDFPTGLVIETGTLNLKALYDDPFTGSAKLTGKLIAKAGMETVFTPWANSDYAIFNPGQFDGVYTPNPTDPTKGIVSGSLFGGVMGFATSIAEGNVVNEKKPGNTNPNAAEVGDPFRVTGNLSTYLAVGAPPLLDRDLERYQISLVGEAKTVVGTTVNYQGTFRIVYSNPGLTTSIETGTFDIIAVYGPTTSAILTGTLTAKPGMESAIPPFNTTDYAPFGPAKFRGVYDRLGNGSYGNLRGGMVGGSLAVPIQSRKLGSMFEGSVTAATQTDDARRAIVVSGAKLFVLDPATCDDAPGWTGGKTLDGKVMARPAVLKDDLFVGTDAGTLYRFDLKTGTLLNSGKPAGGGKIYTAPAPDFTSGNVFVAVSNVGAGNEVVVVKVAAADFNTPLATRSIGNGVISVSSPSVPYGEVFVGTNAGMFTLRGDDLTIQAVTALPVPTSPLTVGSSVYVATGTGTTFTKLNALTGAQQSAFELASPLMMGAFYEKQTDLIQAGTADGRIASFNNAGGFVGYTLPGLFNPEITGGSYSMPVESNKIIYRATESKELISGKPINGDDQQMIALLSVVRGAMSATGQTPGADYLLATSADGTLHTIGIR